MPVLGVSSIDSARPVRRLHTQQIGAGAFFVPGRVASCGMPTDAETIALQVMRKLHNSTGGEPQQWRAVADISAAGDAQEALQLAVDRGWLLVEGGHSICLTDAGRQLVGE